MGREEGGPGHSWAGGCAGVPFVVLAVRFNDFDLQPLWVDEYLWTPTASPTRPVPARTPPRG